MAYLSNGADDSLIDTYHVIVLACFRSNFPSSDVLFIDLIESLESLLMGVDSAGVLLNSFLKRLNSIFIQFNPGNKNGNCKQLLTSRLANGSFTVTKLEAKFVNECFFILLYFPIGA